MPDDRAAPITIADDDAAGWKAEALRLRALAEAPLPDGTPTQRVRVALAEDGHSMIVTATGLDEHLMAASVGAAYTLLIAAASAAERDLVRANSGVR